MVAWNRKEVSLSTEEVFSDSDPGLLESVAVDPDGDEDLGAPLVQVVDRLQELVGNGLQAILCGDWQQLLGTVNEEPIRVIRDPGSESDTDFAPV